MYKIDKGIPIPQAPNKNGGRKSQLIKELQDGDSVFLDDKFSARHLVMLATRLRSSGKIPSNKFLVSRKVEGGYRVWCVIKDNE